MNLQQFLLILRARYKLVLFTLLGTVAVTLVLSLVLPKQYTATSAVVVDVKSPDPIAGMMLPALIMPGYMATQVDIINSDRVAQPRLPSKGDSYCNRSRRRASRSAQRPKSCSRACGVANHEDSRSYLSCGS